MRRSAIWLAGLLAAGAIGRCAGADMKIGVVDMEKVLAAHPDTREAEGLMQKEIEGFEAERKDQQQKFEKLRQEFEDARAESENRALSEDGRLAKRKEAERKLEEMRDFDEQVRQSTSLRQRQIRDRKSRMRARIVEDIKSVIRDYAQKQSYTLVLDSGPVMDAFGVVVYSVESMDLTDAVTKILVETRKGTLNMQDLARPGDKPPKPAGAGLLDRNAE